MARHLLSKTLLFVSIGCLCHVMALFPISDMVGSLIVISLCSLSNSDFNARLGLRFGQRYWQTHHLSCWIDCHFCVKSGCQWCHGKLLVVLITKLDSDRSYVRWMPSFGPRRDLFGNKSDSLEPLATAPSERICTRKPASSQTPRLVLYWTALINND